MIYFKDQFVTVWSVEDKGNYAVVKMSTARKDKETQEYKNTNWSFVRFVGKAYTPELLDLPEKARLTVAGGISQEAYLKDGEKLWPKNPQVVVFHWTESEDTRTETPTTSKMDKPPVVESSPIDEDEDPFADKA